MALRGPDRVAVDALGADAFAASALDRVVDAQHDRTGRRKGSNKEAQRQTGGRASLPRDPVEDAMVVGEPSLPAEPRDPQEAGHRAFTGGENGADQQQLGMAPGPRLQEHRRESQDDGGEAGWQVHGDVSWRGRASLSPVRSAASPAPPAARAPPEWPKSS
jgi:hypothetical protein